MSRILIYVEGQSEETFVHNVLAPHLQSLGIFMTPIPTTTKPVKNGPNFRGGMSTYGKARRDVKRLTGDTDTTAITTMLDYYGLPSDFPGRRSLPGGSCYEKVKYLEEAFGNDIDSGRFIPFLTLHEFEALLFSSPYGFGPIFPGTEIAHKIQEIRSKFNSPEEIDEGKNTHPSKRIQSFEPRYRKRFHGPLIAAEIGLDTIRNECSHFNEWLTKLESFAD